MRPVTVLTAAGGTTPATRTPAARRSSATGPPPGSVRHHHGALAGADPVEGSKRCTPLLSITPGTSLFSKRSGAS